MISVVLDTNVLIDAQKGTGSYQQRILDLIINKKLESVATRAVIKENILIAGKLVIDPSLKNQINQYLSEVTIVEPRPITISLADEQDHKLLQAAVGGRVDFLITEDRHLLDVGGYQKIKIVRPIEFWYIWQKQADEQGDSWHNWVKNILGK